MMFSKAGDTPGVILGRVSNHGDDADNQCENEDDDVLQ